jgi:tRNA(Ile)-lysidine synthase
VLPSLEAAIPGSSAALARLAENTSSDLEIVDWAVSQHLAGAMLAQGNYARAKVSYLPRNFIARVLMRAYEDHTGHSLDLERKHISDMVDQVTGRSGTAIDLPNGVTFRVDRDSFTFSSGTDDDCPYPSPLEATELRVPGVTTLDRGFTMTVRIIDRPTALESGSPWVTFAAREALTTAPRLRNRRDGDRFQPLGMEPQVKLQDFFVGAGVPGRWRDRVPIVETDRGIVWVAGSRLAEWAKVQADHVQVARIELVRPG